MNCCNCGEEFCESVPKINTILSTWNEDKFEKDNNKSLHEQLTQRLTSDHLDKNAEEDFLITANIVPVSEALSIIFEIPPLSPQPYCDLQETLFPTQTAEDTESSSEGVLELCPKCAHILTELYNSFKGFTSICKLECEIARRLQEIGKLRQSPIITPPKQEVEEVSNIKVSANKRKKRGRPRGSGRGKNSKKAKAADTSAGSGQVAAGGLKVEIKKEQPDLDIEVGDELDLDGINSDDGELFDEYYGGMVSPASSSPPDSPVSMDLDEIPRRSPRPVRRTSARNKNWAKLYQELEDDDDELLAPIKPGVVVEPLNKVEVTFDDGPQDKGESEILVGNPTKEEEAYEPVLQNEDDDDDEDEEYRPDEDLEEMYASADEKKPRRHRIVPKRHTSMFKSINRSMKQYMRKSSSGSFVCTECGKCFGHRKSLERHFRTHTEDDGTVQCPTCSKLFSRDDHLKRHRRQVHGEDLPLKTWKKEGGADSNSDRQPKQYECPICQESYTRKLIQEHVETHKVENPWTCKTCPKQFPSLALMNQHWTAVHYERPRVSCSVCSREFRSTYHLRRHQVSIHHVRIDKLVLDDSSDEFEEDDEKQEASGVEELLEQKLFDEHGNRVLSIPPPKTRKVKAFKCIECFKKFKRKEKLEEHLLTHGIGETHKCEICGREFNHIRSKQRHMVLHSEENPYRCNEKDCVKGFSRKDHLARHKQKFHGIVTLEGEMGGPPGSAKLEKKPKEPLAREIQCEHCDKVIKRERMRLHMVIHTGEKRHMCDLCGQKFGLRTTLLTHIQCVHQGVRKYTCSYCDRAFKRSNHLKDHEKLHTDKDSKPFVCEICAKPFRRSKNLKSHMICHEGSKDYMCELCGKAFNRIDNMRAHVKTVHEGLQIRKKKPPAGSAAVASTAASNQLVEGMGEEDIDGHLSPVVLEVRRQPQRSKRGARVKVTSISTDHSIAEDDQASAAGALVALAIDPVNPHDVVTMDQDDLAAATAAANAEHGDSNTDYESEYPQRTTILIPQTQGNIYYYF